MRARRGIRRRARYGPRDAPRARRRAARAWLRATGMMPSAVMSKVTSATWSAASPWRRSPAASRGCKNILDRHHAVGQLLAEAAQEADRERLGRDVHCEVAMIDVADALAADQRARRDAAQRRRGVGMAPQQRQGRGDQAGAHHREQRDHAFHRVGKLDATTASVGRPKSRKPRRERRDGTVGLRVSEAAHRPVGEGRAVGRIDQRERIGPARQRAAEQVVECRLHGGNCRIWSSALKSSPTVFAKITSASLRLRLAPPGFRKIAEQRGRGRTFDIGPARKPLLGDVEQRHHVGPDISTRSSARTAATTSGASAP